jgi:ABC-type transport system involved in multi-copper enzyme maturation permease subunit
MTAQTAPQNEQPTGNRIFEPVAEKGWRRGLANLHRSEFGRWFGTKLWLTMALMWTAIFNFMLAGVLRQSEQPMSMGDAYGFFLIFAGMFPSIAVVIIMQDVLVGEKQNGAAAWILSKPVSRPAFVISKLIPNSVGVVTSMALMPTLVAYLLIGLISGGWAAPLNLAAVIAIISLNLIFFLTMTLMLGALTDSSAAVIAIPLAFAFTQQYLAGLLPFLKTYLPWGLFIPMVEGQPTPTMAIITGQPPDLQAVWFTAICCILFTAVAIWRFDKTEL